MRQLAALMSQPKKRGTVDELAYYQQNSAETVFKVYNVDSDSYSTGGRVRGLRRIGPMLM